MPFSTLESDAALQGLVAQLEPYAYPKDNATIHAGHSPIKSITHKIARAVMRNPSLEVLMQLHFLHQVIKNEFLQMHDESIEWLLGGAPKSRGGFKNAASFKDFFNKDPTLVSPSRLITALNTVFTAIGYRSVDAIWVTPPSQPKKNTHHFAYLMYSQIKTKFPREALPPTIGKYAYTARTADEISDACGLEEDCVEIISDDLSDASDVDYEEEKKPKHLSPKKRFRKKLLDTELSWLEGALQGNIPIRCHVSGTAPLVLAIINQLYERYGNLWIKEDDNVRRLTGVLLHPNYERGNFHTFAETAGGVEYSIEARALDKKATTTLSPQLAFMVALQHMMLATEGALRDILIKISPLIIGKTQDIPVKSRMELDDYINIIQTSKDSALVRQIKDISCINKIMGPILYEIRSSTRYSISEKISKLSAAFQLIINSEHSHKNTRYCCFFTRTQTTPAYQNALKSLKETLLHALKELKVGELSKKEVEVAKEILSTHRTCGPHIFAPTSLSHKDFKPHASAQPRV